MGALRRRHVVQHDDHNTSASSPNNIISAAEKPSPSPSIDPAKNSSITLFHYLAVVAALIYCSFGLWVAADTEGHSSLPLQRLLQVQDDRFQAREEQSSVVAILFPSHAAAASLSLASLDPFQFPTKPFIRLLTKDYGGLAITILKQGDDRIITQKEKEYTYIPEYLANKDHREESFRPDYDDYEEGCHPVNWKDNIYPTCNNFHELHMVYDNDSYNIVNLGTGTWRTAWGFQKKIKEQQSELDDNSFVLKSLNGWQPIDYSTTEAAQTEAAIMERLSRSPRIVDIYGYCGVATLNEHMKEKIKDTIVPPPGYMKQHQLDEIQEANNNQVVSQNNLTSTEKLYLAMGMAEAIADLHGFEGGVITHGDNWPDQLLVSKEGVLKLNDFEGSYIMDYDIGEGQYCLDDRGCSGFAYQSPEELACYLADEKSDVYTLGNNIYVLLTGLWPFYDEGMYWSSVHSTIGPGEKIGDPDIRLRPFVDDRYRNDPDLITSALVAIMEHCWEWDPDERISIFTVILLLQKVQEAEA